MTEHNFSKGEWVISKPSSEYLGLQRVKFLGDSQLDYDYFIGEDEVGFISDDWLISDFKREQE